MSLKARNIIVEGVSYVSADSGVLMSQQLGEESGSAAVGRLEALLRQLPAARAALRDVRERTHALRENAQRLNAGAPRPLAAPLAAPHGSPCRVADGLVVGRAAQGEGAAAADADRLRAAQVPRAPGQVQDQPARHRDTV